MVRPQWLAASSVRLILAVRRSVVIFCVANGAEDVTADHQQERQEEFEQLIRNGTGQCLSPVPDPADSSLLTAVCYSPAMHLKPGQVNPRAVGHFGCS